MPWNAMGEWVNPQGWEDYDVEDLFDQVSTPAGMEDVIGELTGAEGDTLGDIVATLSPYDFREQSAIKRAAITERSSLREAVFAQSADINKLVSKGGFSSSYAGGLQMNDLWTDYLNKTKEISKTQSHALYKSKADYLDRIWNEAMTAESYMGDD